MFWIDLLVALVVAVMVTLVFVAMLGWRRPGQSDGALPLFFLLIFVMTWAGGLWITPFGPTMWGAPWLAFLTIGLIVAVLLAAALPPSPRERGRVAEGPETDPRVAEVTVFNWFFWTLLLVTAVAIVLAYV